MRPRSARASIDGRGTFELLQWVVFLAVCSLIADGAFGHSPFGRVWPLRPVPANAVALESGRAAGEALSAIMVRRHSPVYFSGAKLDFAHFMLRNRALR
jgi:hypothetical protein